MKNKKLLILIKNIDGGTGTFLIQLLKLRKEFDIVVYSLERKKYRQNKLDNKINYFNKKHKYRNYYGLNPLLLLELLREFFWLKNGIEKEKPDAIISIDTHCNILACLMKLQSQDLKVVITTHNNVSAVIERKISKLLRSVLKFIGRYSFNRADAIICVSKGVGEEFKRFFSIKKRIVIIPYGLDFSEVKHELSEAIPVEYKNIFLRKNTKIISIGRFEEQKDFVTLIKAFKRVVNQSINTKLILIGDGTQRNDLQELIKELKLGENVYFLGWQKNVYPFLKASDLFVLSSNYEGFGYVLLEAMSQGLPIISTDAPFGPSEVLDKGKYGILTPVGDVNKLANAMLKLLNNKSEYKKYSQKSSERIKFYKEEKMLKAYKKIIESLDNQKAE